MKFQKPDRKLETLRAQAEVAMLKAKWRFARADLRIRLSYDPPEDLVRMWAADEKECRSFVLPYIRQAQRVRRENWLSENSLRR